MARIRDIRLISLRYEMPKIEAYGMARGLHHVRQSTIVEVVTEDGVVGLGEAWGPPRALAGYLEAIRDFYRGRTLFEREHVFLEVVGRLYHLGIQNEMVACMSGINVAIYDALGKTLGVSVADLLGGRIRDEIPAYASDGYFTNHPDNQLERQIEIFAGGGFPGCKFKIGKNPKSDVERCRIVRDALGPETLLMVDVNGNYTVDLALESMRRTAEFDIHFYEEPLPPHDFAGYRRLSERSLVPVATGEALYTVFDFARLLKKRAVDVVQPDLTLVGGFDEALKIRALCQVHNVRYSPHVWGSAVGLAAALHFMAAYPDFPHTDNVPYPRLLEYDVSMNPLRDDLLTLPIRPKAGLIRVPEGPGLGIELDPETVGRYRASI
jgi:D-galactarolactone cycloisomerase